MLPYLCYITLIPYSNIFDNVFSTIFLSNIVSDNIFCRIRHKHYSTTFFDIIFRQHFSTGFDNIRHYSTLFDTIRQYFLSKFVEAEFDNIFRQTLFDNIFRQSRSTTFLDKHKTTAYFVDTV